MVISKDERLQALFALISIGWGLYSLHKLDGIIQPETLGWASIILGIIVLYTILKD